MFMGEFQHAIDIKGRLFMPARFREDLGDRFVLTKGLDGCLFVYPMKEWSALELKIRSLPVTMKDARAFSRFLFAGATDCEVDKQGRILVPANLREYAGLDKETMIIGVSSRVEIWSAARWQEYNESAAGSLEEIAEKIGGFDLGI
ncbi:MAG: cell division protein MraZ [Peptococcaceae bacterium BRH_c4b]|nr:MAG: cell division protein MraZ [Peptococcaceae bacterium BRH_c4b]